MHAQSTCTCRSRCAIIRIDEAVTFTLPTLELLEELVLPWLTDQAVPGVTKKHSYSLKSGGEIALKQCLRERVEKRSIREDCQQCNHE